jgi:beta-lactamase superfamily II metal-dependent hydrolase
MRVLAEGRRGAVLLLEWENFRALLPVGIDFETLEILQDERSLVPVNALLLAESGYAPVNPPEWIDKLRPQVVLLSVAPDDREGLPSPETLQAVEGLYPAAHRPERLGPAQHGWRADVGGGGA